MRTLLASLAVLAFVCSGSARADDKKTTPGAAADKSTSDTKSDKGNAATITKVDKAGRTITVKMKDKSGKEVEKTLKLTEEVRMLDNTGRAAAIDVFRSGDEILVIEEAGRLREVRQHKGTTPREKTK